MKRKSMNINIHTTMKKQYIRPTIHIIPIQPAELLCQSAIGFSDKTVSGANITSMEVKGRWFDDDDWEEW